MAIRNLTGKTSKSISLIHKASPPQPGLYYLLRNLYTLNLSRDESDFLAPANRVNLVAGQNTYQGQSFLSAEFGNLGPTGM